MKATGIVREIDSLGRIVIPKDIRKTLKIDEGTPIEIFMKDDGNIILRKYNPGCDLCGEEKLHSELQQYKAALICKDCYAEIKK